MTCAWAPYNAGGLLPSLLLPHIEGTVLTVQFPRAQIEKSIVAVGDQTKAWAGACKADPRPDDWEVEVMDPAGWTNGILAELTKEDEHGNTLLTEALDAALRKAIRGARLVQTRRHSDAKFEVPEIRAWPPKPPAYYNEPPDGRRPLVDAAEPAPGPPERLAPLLNIVDGILVFRLTEEALAPNIRTLALRQILEVERFSRPGEYGEWVRAVDSGLLKDGEHLIKVGDIQGWLRVMMEELCAPNAFGYSVLGHAFTHAIAAVLAEAQVQVVKQEPGGMLWAWPPMHYGSRLHHFMPQPLPGDVDPPAAGTAGLLATMQATQARRLSEERNEVQRRLQTLVDAIEVSQFIETKRHAEPQEEVPKGIGLLIKQRFAMAQYLAVLEERIALLADSTLSKPA